MQYSVVEYCIAKSESVIFYASLQNHIFFCASLVKKINAILLLRKKAVWKAFSHKTLTHRSQKYRSSPAVIPKPSTGPEVYPASGKR